MPIRIFVNPRARHLLGARRVVRRFEAPLRGVFRAALSWPANDAPRLFSRELPARFAPLSPHIPLISRKNPMVSSSASTSASTSPAVLYRYALALAVAGTSKYRCSGCVQ